MSRIRTQGQIVTLPAQGYVVKVVNPNNTAITVGGYNIPRNSTREIVVPNPDDGKLGKLSTMEDNPGSRYEYHAVNHTVETWEAEDKSLPGEVFQLQTSSGLPYSTSFIGKMNGVACHRSLNSGLSGLDSIDAMKARAAVQMKPGSIPVGFDLQQFIGEITDFVPLVSGLSQRLANVPRAFRELIAQVTDPRFNVNRIMNQIDNQRFPWRSLRPSGAVEAGLSLDLFRKLVWNPLIRDMQALRRAVFDIDRAYTRLRNAEPFVIRASESSGIGTNFGPINSSLGYKTYRAVRMKSRRVVTWAKVKLDPPPITRWEFLSNYFNLWPRASTLWELTPLSFLVDYVADIGQWIRQFEQGQLKIPYRVLESGYSVKDVTVSHGTESPWWGTAFTGGAAPAPVGSKLELTEYKRFRQSDLVHPGNIAPIDIRLPSFSQAVTAIEIAILALRRR